MVSRGTAVSITDSPLYCMQPPIAKSGRRYGAHNFGDESIVSSNNETSVTSHARQVNTTSPHGDISMLLSSSSILVYSAIFRLRAPSMKYEALINIHSRHLLIFLSPSIHFRFR